MLVRKTRKQAETAGRHIFIVRGFKICSEFSLPCFTEPASPSTRDGRERNIKCVEALSHKRTLIIHTEYVLGVYQFCLSFDKTILL